MCMYIGGEQGFHDTSLGQHTSWCAESGSASFLDPAEGAVHKVSFAGKAVEVT